MSFIKIICISNYTRYLILIKLIKHYIITSENNNNKKDKWKIFKKYQVVILSLIYLRNNLIQSFYKIILSLLFKFTKFLEEANEIDKALFSEVKGSVIEGLSNYSLD